MTYADNLRKAINEKGWSQNKTAWETWGKEVRDSRGYPQPWGKDLISSYVHGKREPSPKHEELIDKAFGFSVRMAERPTIGQRRWDQRHSAGHANGLVYFEWCGHLSPEIASKVSALIADDVNDRVFQWHMSEAP